jgi:hypothetical protein
MTPSAQVEAQIAAATALLKPGARYVPPPPPEAETAAHAGRLAPEIMGAVRRGWRLHPLRPKDKLPFLKEWQRRAASDPAQIEAWAQEYRGCNWGAVCGPGSGFFAVNVDDPTAMRGLEDEHGLIPEGLTNVTSRGYQLLYEWPEDADVRPATNCPCEGIDVRGRDSYIVIPPSVHPTGHVYRYSDGSLPIPACPPWLLTLILNRPQAAAQPLQDAPAAGAVGEGQRTRILCRMIGKLHSDGVPAESIEAAALALNATFIPPLPDQKVRKGLVEYMTKHYPAGSLPNGAAGELHLLKGTEIVEQEQPMILADHLPDHTAVTINARPGDGKTTCALLICADLSAGKTPYTGTPCAPRNVLVMSNEDSPSRIRRLFSAAGGDVNRLRVENCDDLWQLTDLPRFEEAISANTIGVAVIDSLASHSGKSDLNSHQDTMQLLVPLRALAEKYRCLFLVIHHLNKSLSADHIAKVAGSVGIIAAFRHNLHVCVDPENPELRLLVNGKSNLIAPNAPALRFKLFPVGWAGEARISIDDVYRATEPDEKPGKAVAWLQEALADGEWQDAGKLQQQATQGFDLSRRSIFRAADTLAVERRKVGFGGRAEWRLSITRETRAGPGADAESARPTDKPGPESERVEL